MIVVVFSAMALEAFFNNYAAACLGDEEFYGSFDKLSLIDKFVLIAKFIIEVEVDKSQNYYFLLKELTKARNNFVHSKSKQFHCLGMTEEEYEAFLQHFDGTEYEEFGPDRAAVNDVFSMMKRAIKTLKAVADFFDSYDSNILAAVRLFPICFSIMSDEREKPIRAILIQDFAIKRVGES